MKEEPYKNLRYCQRLKQTQCFIQADSLQKKIRKMNANNQLGNIDADNKMRQIDSFWKEGWKYDMTHHTYVEPKITIPQFFIENSSQAAPQLERYYQVLKKFITKLKIEHEDQTNYRIKIAQYSSTENQPDESMKKSAEYALEHLLTLFSRVTSQMEEHFEKSKMTSSDLMMEDLDQTIKSSLYFLQSICQNIIHSSPQIEETAQHQAIKDATTKFIAFMINQMMKNKESSMRMSVLTVQPIIGELTYLMHPMCFAIYGLFAHEIVLKDAKKRRGKCYADDPQPPLQMDYGQIPSGNPQFIKIGDNFKVEEERHSKIVFLNLDGYESQFTLETVRNFSHHLMYISFPKYSPNHSDEGYNRRFHKKIMYYSTKPQSSLLFEPDESQALTLQRQELLENPQHYHQTVETLYQENAEETEITDLNKNVYVFPIRMDNLKSEKEPPEPYRDIQAYQSNFIRFMLRDHLYAEMRRFKPTSIIISYSGKIKIEHDHFIEIIQEISKIGSKILLFPNYTTALIKEKMNEYFDNYETMPAYDKVHNDIGKFIVESRQPTTLEHKLEFFYEESRSNPYYIDLMDKLAIFLKISSGHYNLIRPYEQESFENKYKNCQIFPYIIHLFDALKNQYDHCKQRLRRDSLEVALKTMQKSIEMHENELAKCVPIYYQELFAQIEKILRQGRGISQKSINGRYLLVEEWLEKAEMMEWDQKQLLKRWYRFRTAQSLTLANAKYHEIQYLQLQIQVSKVQFTNLTSEKMDDLDSVFKLSFYLRDHNTELLRIYKEATFLHSTRQFFKHVNQFHLLISNMLSLDEQKYELYATRGKIGKKQQKCLVAPVTFRNKQGVIERSKFEHLVEWNYAQSQNYILLYWPQQFDHFEYYLHKMLQKTYHKRLTDLIFICHKQTDFNPRNQRVVFHQLTLPEPANVLPRWGCSVFCLDDQLYFFGGFHDRESSYLDLQNEITTLDLTDFKPDQYQPKKLHNLRKQLYCGQVFNGHLRQQRTPSSFVRPRMDFEFYDYDELNLDEDEIQQQGIKKVILTGGYGQDFKTPHSILINYYYLLRFERATRRLLSVHKKYIRNKVIPINTRAMIKNRGNFNKTNILDQRQGTDDKGNKVREALSTNDHYFCHRVVYAIQNGNLTSKIKSNFGIELFQMCKKEYQNFGRLIGQVKVQRQLQPVLVRKIQNSRHHIMVEVKDKIYIFKVMLEIKKDEIEEVSLTHESIISIDTRKFNVFALISHATYTRNKTVLTSNSIIQPDPLLSDQEQNFNLVLKQVYTFEQELNLHCLIACNHNQVAILQGLPFEGNRRPEYLVKIKSKTKGDVKKEENNESNPMTIQSDQVNSIKTFFYKKNNEITGYNFIKMKGANEELSLVKQQLDINKFTQGWKNVMTIKRIIFIHGGEKIRVNELELRIQNYNAEAIFLKVVEGGRGQKQRQFYIKISDLTSEKEVYQVKQIVGAEQYRFRYQQLLPFTTKTEDKYYDYEYFG